MSMYLLPASDRELPTAPVCHGERRALKSQEHKDDIPARRNSLTAHDSCKPPGERDENRVTFHQGCRGQHALVMTVELVPRRSPIKNNMWHLSVFTPVYMRSSYSSSR